MNQDQIIFFVSLVGLALFAGVAARKFLKRRRAHRWPTAGGEVDVAEVHFQEGISDTSGAWVATVKYHYGAPGQSHSGTHHRNFMTKGRTEKWIAAYATGGVLAVRVNPRKHEDSVVLENDNVSAALARAATYKGNESMNVANINNPRGTVIKVPDTTPGILSVNGKQYFFTLEGVWKSAIAPSPNQTVTVGLDSAGVLTSVAVLDQQQLAKEKLGELSGVAQEHGKVIAGQLKGGVVALAARMGAVTLGAAVVIWIASYFLTAGGISGGAGDMGSMGSYSFRTLLGTDLTDPNSLMNPGHARGLLRLIALVAIAVPFAVPFIRTTWSRYLNAAPLAAALLGWLVIHENIAKGFGGEPGMESPFSFKWGFYVLLLACVVLASSALKKPVNQT
jgi:hypothetical protein